MQCLEDLTLTTWPGKWHEGKKSGVGCDDVVHVVAVVDAFAHAGQGVGARWEEPPGRPGITTIIVITTVDVRQKCPDVPVLVGLVKARQEQRTICHGGDVPGRVPQEEFEGGEPERLSVSPREANAGVEKDAQ